MRPTAGTYVTTYRWLRGGCCSPASWRGCSHVPSGEGCRLSPSPWGFIREVPTGPEAGAVGMCLAGGGGTGRGPRVDEMGLGTGASAALQLAPMSVRGTVAWGVTGESWSTSTQIFGRSFEAWDAGGYHKPAWSDTGPRVPGAALPAERSSGADEPQVTDSFGLGSISPGHGRAWVICLKAPVVGPAPDKAPAPSRRAGER